MTDHANELRRYSRKIAFPAGDVPSVMLAAADEIEQLCASLEAAEAECLEQARLNGMGSEREAALMAKLEAAEKERDAVAHQLVQSERGKRKISEECDALRAKIAEMERQEPVGKFIQHPSNGIWEQDGYGDNPDARPLYALPGAQPSYLPSDLADAIIADMQAQFDSELITENDSGEALIRLDGAIAAVEDNFAAAPEAKP